MSKTTRHPGSEGQTFLVGPTIYLRGIESDDAQWGAAWYPMRFPLPPEVLEDQLKEEVPANARKSSYRLVACRRSDDRPIGSVAYDLQGDRWSDMTVYANPLYSAETRDTIRAELISLIVPYLLIERDLMAVWLEIESGVPLIEEAVAEAGMRQAFRLREALLVDGVRRDQVCYEALHPSWVARHGLPPAATEGPVEREVRSPAPRTFPAIAGDPPANATMVGERVYLRPIIEDDAEAFAYWSRREPETFFDSGRPIRSPLSISVNHRKLSDADPPEWLRFAICLRENDEFIGANGIDGIDLIQRTAETESEILLVEYRNGGYGTEAKHLLLAYAFEQLGLHAVRSYVWQPNGRSAAALRKQGYRDAGLIAWSGQKNGELVGDFVFDLLASEWQAARR